MLAAEVERVLAPVAKPLRLEGDHRPHVILVVGVNGTGKTTTIGKLAQRLSRRARRSRWRPATPSAPPRSTSSRSGASARAPRWSRARSGADSAGLAFDALKRGAREFQRGVADRHRRPAAEQAGADGGAREGHSRAAQNRPKRPHQVLLVLDATTGQNALNQVEVFKRQAGVTGLVMTKLDGTAKGGDSRSQFRPSSASLCMLLVLARASRTWPHSMLESLRAPSR